MGLPKPINIVFTNQGIWVTIDGKTYKDDPAMLDRALKEMQYIAQMSVRQR